MPSDKPEYESEALDFVLAFARPQDLSLSSDEATWRKFDAGKISRRELAERLGLWDRVVSESERITRPPDANNDAQRIADLHEDLLRIFGDELGEVEVGTSGEGWPVVRSADGACVYFRDGGPTATFARHRRLGDRVEATLWNRAGVRVDRRMLDLPAGGGSFG